jgi:mono/diheme cytochrome c family protein
MRHILLASALLLAGAIPARAQYPDKQSFEVIEHGRYMASAADCTACHTAPGGKPLAGGGALETPFGILLAPNITPDIAAGIGGWTDDEFVNAVQNGIGHGGIHLYPAMPYPYYTKMTREDVIAIRAHLDTVEPVHNLVQANQLPFPFNQREAMVGWNALYFTPGEFKPDPGKPAEWNRGAYLVEGAEHCGLCHTPKNAMGGDENSRAMQGSVLQNWFAPDLTGSRRVGIGDWTVDDIALYLKTGRNRYDIASGPMADMVTHSTAHLTDGDLRAIAVYLKDLPPGGSIALPPVAAQDPSMQRGEAIYNERCAACHTVAGEGIVGLFPRLSAAPLVQQSQATSLIRVVLEGSRAVATDGAPTGPAMPSFAWQLSDAEVAAVVTYIRNAWGNTAPAVSAGEVANMRQTLHRQAQSP